MQLFCKYVLTQMQLDDTITIVALNTTFQQGEKMTNTNLHKEVIKESGVTITWLADKMGCSRPRIYKILDGGDATASEIQSLSKALRLTDSIRNKIFFAD